ncbi:glycosyltransferase family 9 protein [Saccharobesus litoralis]|uniref:glycosyltransferase family 9 protein n=1 Tax=Saccharobesus litoralis TaxID=2172099 RepID=UPI00131F1931|nr:glycosyltransferase family 9 protein [Saccharobesus litoralis]
MSTKAPQHILIIRLSAIGDVIMASAIIPAIKRTYPQAKISWLVEPVAADLLAENPLIDNIIHLPRNEWRTLRKQRQYIPYLKSQLVFAKRLREHKFDWVLDMQGLVKSGIWAKVCRAERRISLGGKEGSHLLVNEVVPRIADAPRIGSEYLDLAHYVDLKVADFSMSVPFNRDTQQSAQTMLSAAGVKGRYIAISPFTTRAQKHWITQYWFELAQFLHQKYVLPIVILGGPQDKQQAEAMLKQMPKSTVNLAGQTRLLQAAAIIQQASVLIGVDTGLTHLGISQKTPTIAIFGSTLPYSDTSQPNAHVLHHKMPCSPCRRHPTCGAKFDCMRAIQPQDVFALTEQWLKIGG